jgi:hypothetical protein
MAYTKRITTKAVTGSNVYAIITRMADGYRINDATGAFANAPADPYIAMTEDATEKGVYVLSESRAAWNDGRYRVTTYLRAGGAENPTADAPPIDAYEIVLSGDQVVGNDTLNTMGIVIRSSVLGISKRMDDHAKQLAEINKQLKIGNAFASYSDKPQKRA